MTMSFLTRLLRKEPRNAPPLPEGDAIRIGEVEAILEELRPLFRADGGDMQLVRVSASGEVSVRLVGACGSCSLSSLTLRGAVEPLLAERLDWFNGIHSA